MSKIITDKCEITFAALKLVEQLYKDNEIPDYEALQADDYQTGPRVLNPRFLTFNPHLNKLSKSFAVCNRKTN